jgi:transcriptional regulator of aromatic amino acid metabolism
MFIFLIVVSFLLHLISIFAIVVLFQRRSLERVSLPSLQEDVETIHQSIESFVDELEKENEALYDKLLQHIKKKENEWDGRLKLLEEKYHALELPTVSVEPIHSTKIEQESIRETGAAGSKEEENKQQPEALEHENKDPKFQQALDLFNQGFSPDQIAKVLHIGKGEANLIVNMINKYREN